MFRGIYIQQIYGSGDIYRVNITIIDDDFKENFNFNEKLPYWELAIKSIINIYSTKQLNVAHNLILWIISLHEEDSSLSINDIITICSIIPEFGPYLDEVKKLLIFN